MLGQDGTWRVLKRFLLSQQQRICLDQMVVTTMLSLQVLTEMNLHMSIPTASPDTANELKSIGLSLALITHSSL